MAPRIALLIVLTTLALPAFACDSQVSSDLERIERQIGELSASVEQLKVMYAESSGDQELLAERLTEVRAEIQDLAQVIEERGIDGAEELVGLLMMLMTMGMVSDGAEPGSDPFGTWDEGEWIEEEWFEYEE